MYARVASFEGGDTERIRQLNEERLAAGTMNLPEGIRRILVLGDEQGGRRLFITFFDHAEAVAAAEQRFDQMGEEIPEDVRGRRTAIDVYKVEYDEAT